MIKSFVAEIKMFFKYGENSFESQRKVVFKLGLYVSLWQLQRFCRQFCTDLKPVIKHICCETEGDFGKGQ